MPHPVSGDSSAPDIEIFRAGTHTASDGRSVTVTATDLADIAERYDPANDQAPIVVGHPKTNGPAYGWVTRLRVVGDRLVATAGQVDPAFADLVRAGRYKKISASFKPVSGGGMALRHVGFLGAVPPAVKGLKEAVFADDPTSLVFDFTPPPLRQESTTVDTTQIEQLAAAHRDLQAKFAALEADNTTLAKTVHNFAESERATRRVADQSRIEKLVSAGRVPPAVVGAVAALIEFLDGGKAGVLEFFEGDAKVSRTAKDTLFAVLERTGKTVEFGVFVPGVSGGPINFNDPVAIADAATAHQAEMTRHGTPITSADAVLHIMKGRRS